MVNVERGCLVVNVERGVWWAVGREVSNGRCWEGVSNGYFWEGVSNGHS